MPSKHQPTTFMEARNILLCRFRSATAQVEKEIMDPGWLNPKYGPFMEAIQAMNEAIDSIRTLNQAECSVNPNQ